MIHLDGDALNNRRANLRVVAAAEVPQRGRPQRDGTSAHRGVCWSATARKWRAYGNLDGRQRHPGLFDDEAEVAPVAAEWRRQHMPYSAEAMEDARTTDVPPPEGCRSGKPTR